MCETPSVQCTSFSSDKWASWYFRWPLLRQWVLGELSSKSYFVGPIENKEYFAVLAVRIYFGGNLHGTNMFTRTITSPAIFDQSSGFKTVIK